MSVVMKVCKIVLVLGIASLFIGFGSFATTEQTPLIDFDLSQVQKERGITTVPKELSTQFSRELRFNRYTSVVAPNGKAIHIVAQDKLRDSQIIRARSVLEHYLTDFPASKYGRDKSTVANKMADNGATLMLLNGSDDGRNPAAELDGQPLFQEEIQVEGGTWYMTQNYEHRDATFEEILHLVHDYGIGVDGYTKFIGALPSYQAEIRHAQLAALKRDIWGMGSFSKDLIDELANENSLSQEYLASVIDSYYGLWGAFPSQPMRMMEENTGGYGMWGVYIAANRDEVQQRDPLGYQLAEDFFQPYLTYDANLDPSLSGVFSLQYDENKLYTNQSRYLKDVTVTGNNEVDIVVNELDNNITGNSQLNRVIFSGFKSDYLIGLEGEIVRVTDKVAKRDGINQLKNIEVLQFKDEDIRVSELSRQ